MSCVIQTFVLDSRAKGKYEMGDGGKVPVLIELLFGEAAETAKRGGFQAAGALGGSFRGMAGGAAGPLRAIDA